MSDNKLTIPISLSDETIELIIYGENSGETLIEKFDAKENGEAQFQINEGCYYEYKITNGYSLGTSEIISESKVNQSAGRISPNIYVGTLNIDILDSKKQKCGEINLEVQSVKTSYRQDYRHMLEEITEKCTDLLLQHSSPVSQFFEVNFDSDANTLYQRFAFIKSIIDSVEFNDSVHKIISAPVSRWKEIEVIKDIRGVKRLNSSAIRQLASANNRVDLPSGHPMKRHLQSIPNKLKVSNKTETVDTPENRFVKHALVSLQLFIIEFRTKLNDNNRIKIEAELMIYKLEQFLSHSIFKEISKPSTLPLNSPVLQRKEGYRQVLKVWLMFDLAAKMIWHGGDDVYSGNKRDVAVLYEYWLFFKLLDIIKEVFKMDSMATENLIEQTKDGLGLKLKQGKFLPIEGVYNTDKRKLRIEFSYNKTFTSDNKYPHGGSWTRSLRPDYTLSIWPFGIEQVQAEKEELIVHIHFDAKYKIENLLTIFGEENNLDAEKEEQKKGTYKRADILKMHTYRDAIRRTAGAYILYPGSVSDIKHGFHELIPGLGAFAIRPSKSNNGIEELTKFLNEVIVHFLNRGSQREKLAFRTYDIYKQPPNADDEVNELLPEAYNANRDLIPDSTFVLVGFYNSVEQYDWIKKNNLYNFRVGSGKGSLILDRETVSARYLLLHTSKSQDSGDLWKIIGRGPQVFSKEDLIKKGYPSPSQKNYLVIKIEPVNNIEFETVKWDFKKLSNYSSGRGSALPFTANLTELMKYKIK